MKKRRRIAFNALVNYVAFVLQLGFSLIQLKILTNYMSSAELGLYFFSIGLSLIATSIAIAGFQPVFIRFIPLYEARGEADSVARLLGLAILTYFALGTAFLVGLELIVPQIRLTMAMRAVLLFSFMQLLNFAIQGMRKMIHFALFPIAFSAGFNLSLYLLRHNLTPSLVFFLLAAWAAIIIPMQLKVIGVRPRFDRLKEIFNSIVDFWKYAFANALLYPLILYADRIIIWQLGRPSDVAIFSIAKKFSDVGRRGLHVMTHVAAPEISHEHVMGKRSIAKLYQVAFVILGFLMVIVTVLMGKWLIVTFSSPEYESSYRYLIVLVIGVAVAGYWETEAITAYSMGRMDISLKIWVSWTVLYLGLAYCIGKFMGVMGVAIAYTTASFLVTGAVLIRKRIIRGRPA